MDLLELLLYHIINQRDSGILLAVDVACQDGGTLTNGHPRNLCDSCKGYSIFKGILEEVGLVTFYKCITGGFTESLNAAWWSLEQLIEDREKLKYNGRRYYKIQITMVGGTRDACINGIASS